MRATTVTNTAKDLAAEKAPFLPNYTVVFANPTGGALTVQEDDTAAFSAPATVAVVPADGFIEGTPTKQFIRVSTAATVYILGN
jgi:hypothetical protein